MCEIAEPDRPNLNTFDGKTGKVRQPNPEGTRQPVQPAELGLDLRSACGSGRQLALLGMICGSAGGSGQP